MRKLAIPRLFPALLAAVLLALALAACAAPDLGGLEQRTTANAAAIDELRQEIAADQQTIHADHEQINQLIARIQLDENEIAELRKDVDAELELIEAEQKQIDALLARIQIDEDAIAELRKDVDAEQAAIHADHEQINKILDRLQVDEDAIAELQREVAAEQAAIHADHEQINEILDRLQVDEDAIAELQREVAAELALIEAEQEQIDALLSRVLTDEAIIAQLERELAALTARVNASIPACGAQDMTLNVGFYAFFDPLSNSANSDPNSAAFNTQQGYEADLLDALAAMNGPRITLSRTGIDAWDGIWLKSATPQFDLISGGITILDARTRDAAGNLQIAFTDGHVHFRQSLLVRTEDAGRITTHSDLTGALKVGVLAATTGEHRLLQLLGLVDAQGALLSGVRVDTPNGTVTADGSPDYTITSARVTPNMQGRTALYPPTADLPTIIYLGDLMGEAELLAALAGGTVDALARGDIGNQDAAQNPDWNFAVTALDPQTENGGFTVAADNAALLTCLNQRINWLTDNRNIGYSHWLTDPTVFMQRAQLWNAR